MTRIFLTTLRDQTKAFAYGLPKNTVGNYRLLKGALNQRFKNTALKKSYIVEAKLRRKTDRDISGFWPSYTRLVSTCLSREQRIYAGKFSEDSLDNCRASENSGVR